MNCLQCGKEILPPKKKFCCRKHKNSYNQKHLYNYKYTKSYRGKTPENFLRHLLTYRRRSEFLTKEDLFSLYEKQKGLCAISGIEMTFEQAGGRVPTNISIDRKDSSLGYTPDNVQLVCAIVNTMKMEYDLENLVEWCQVIVDFQKGKSDAPER